MWGAFWGVHLFSKVSCIAFVCICPPHCFIFFGNISCHAKLLVLINRCFCSCHLAGPCWWFCEDVTSDIITNDETSVQKVSVPGWRSYAYGEGRRANEAGLGAILFGSISHILFICFSIVSFFILCVPVHVCNGGAQMGVGGQLVGIVPLLPQSGSLGLNLNPQAWWLMPLPAEPSCCPSNISFIVRDCCTFGSPHSLLWCRPWAKHLGYITSKSSSQQLRGKPKLGDHRREHEVEPTHNCIFLLWDTASSRCTYCERNV